MTKPKTPPRHNTYVPGQADEKKIEVPRRNPILDKAIAENKFCVALSDKHLKDGALVKEGAIDPETIRKAITSQHKKCPCAICGEDCWVGPHTTKFSKETNTPIICTGCAVTLASLNHVPFEDIQLKILDDNLELEEDDD
jgi:hypothetical protein